MVKRSNLTLYEKREHAAVIEFQFSFLVSTSVALSQFMREISLIKNIKRLRNLTVNLNDVLHRRRTVSVKWAEGKSLAAKENKNKKTTTAKERKRKSRVNF